MYYTGLSGEEVTETQAKTKSKYPQIMIFSSVWLFKIQ